MGTTTILDIVGAVVIGGFMLLLLHSLSGRASENASLYSGDLIAQQNLVSLVELLEHDFSRIGYCENIDSMRSPEKMIVAADSTSITFWTDLAQSASDFRGDGIPDKLIYELGADIHETPNPFDKILYRYKDGTTKDASNLGITEFNITYYDNMYNELSHPINTELISHMQIDLKIEDSYGYDTENNDKTHTERFPTVFWRQIRMATKNMSR